MPLSIEEFLTPALAALLWPSCRSRRYLGPDWRNLGPTWRHLGPTWRNVGAISAPSWPSLADFSSTWRLKRDKTPALPYPGRFAKPFALNIAIARSLVRLLFRSFVRSFLRSFARSLVPSFVRSLVRSFVRSFVHSFARSFARSLVRSLVRTLVRSFVRSFARYLRLVTWSFEPIFWKFELKECLGLAGLPKGLE